MTTSMSAERAEWLERFMSRVTVEPGPAGCWLWSGSLNKGGYGSYGYKGRTRNAHRVSWELHVGDVPAGLDLDHLCRVRRCVEPGHLEPVSRSENLRRGDSGKHNREVALAKVSCSKGHPLDDANTYVDPRGRRSCKTCRVLATREWRTRNKEAQ